MVLDHTESGRILARLKDGDEEIAEATVEVHWQGRRRAIHLRLFAVGDEQGQAIGRGLLLRDVTREHDVDEFKTTLLTAVSHEVRTPLAVIKGYASTLLQEDVSWPLADQRIFLQTISSEADRLAQLVSNLLDLSRQEAGLLLIQRAPVQLEDLVERTITRLNQADMTISLDFPADLPLINVDSARIEVVLQNLLSNALIYGESEVRLAVEMHQDEVFVSVTNNGPGIASDELPHIFERFYRARHGRQQHLGGTGVGLAICKAFIEAHGGVVWAESDTQSTRISFSLPMALLTPDCEISVPTVLDTTQTERRKI